MLNWRLCSVVRASEFKSEDPGFDTLPGQSEGQFFCPSESTLVQNCVCLTPTHPSPPPRVYGTHPISRTLKIPYPSVVKE